MPYFSKSATSQSSFPTLSKNSHSFQNGGGVVVLVGFWQAAPTVFVAIICLYFLLIIIGIILNSLVCYVMIKSKRCLKNISCFFITHMAAVDLFCRVVFTPLVVLMSLPTTAEQSPIRCKIGTFVSNSCAAAIFGSLVVIALDRYRNIVHPLLSRKKKRRPFVFASLVWFYAVASSVMFLHTAHNVRLDKLPEGKTINLVGNPTICNISPDYIGSISVTISAIMTFFIPLVILIITYTAIFVSLRRRCQRQLIHHAAAKSKAKAARMLVLVVVGFVLCFGPSVVVQLLRSYRVFTGDYSKGPTTMVIVVLVTDTLEFCSSLFNPLIYTFFSEDFRRDLLNFCNAAKIRRKMHFCKGKVCPMASRPRAAGSIPITTTLPYVITTL